MFRASSLHRVPVLIYYDYEEIEINIFDYACRLPMLFDGGM